MKKEKFSIHEQIEWMCHGARIEKIYNINSNTATTTAATAATAEAKKEIKQKTIKLIMVVYSFSMLLFSFVGSRSWVKKADQLL